MSFGKLTEVSYQIVPNDFCNVDFSYFAETKMYGVFHLQIMYIMPKHVAANLNTWAADQQTQYNRQFVNVYEWYNLLADNLKSEVIRFNNETQQYF